MRNQSKATAHQGYFYPPTQAGYRRVEKLFDAATGNNPAHRNAADKILHKAEMLHIDTGDESSLNLMAHMAALNPEDFPKVKVATPAALRKQFIEARENAYFGNNTDSVPHNRLYEYLRHKRSALQWEEDMRSADNLILNASGEVETDPARALAIVEADIRRAVAARGGKLSKAELNRIMATVDFWGLDYPPPQ